MSGSAVSLGITESIWRPGHEQADNPTGKQQGMWAEKCVAVYTCKSCLITHSAVTQWRSCQIWLADFHFCRCQCIPGAHYRNCDKWQWKSNSQCEWMTHCYIVIRTMFYCGAECWRNLRHFWNRDSGFTFRFCWCDSPNKPYTVPGVTPCTACK